MGLLLAGMMAQYIELEVLNFRGLELGLKTKDGSFLMGIGKVCASKVSLSLYLFIILVGSGVIRVSICHCMSNSSMYLNRFWLTTRSNIE